jgi:hypothetical protein
MGPLVVYRTPLIDRYAYAWMWWHGGWDVIPSPARAPGGDDAVAREPTRRQARRGARHLCRRGLNQTLPMQW